MDIVKNFKEATSCKKRNISSLEKGKLYPTVRAKRITTKYGLTVLLTVRDTESSVFQVFLPKRYSAVISDGDMDKINNSAVSLNLVYKGICETFQIIFVGNRVLIPSQT